MESGKSSWADHDKIPLVTEKFHLSMNLIFQGSGRNLGTENSFIFFEDRDRTIRQKWFGEQGGHKIFVAESRYDPTVKSGI